jgi:hypothetical protein
MAILNTTIDITIRDSANQLVVGAAVTITTVGTVFNLMTDATGSAVASLSLTNRTVAIVNVSAAGLLSVTKNYTISPLENIYNIVLSVDPSQINKLINFLDVNNSPIPGLSVSVNGSLLGKTNNLGQIRIKTVPGVITVQTSGTGYVPLSLSGTYTSTSFPAHIIVKSAQVTTQVLTLQSIAFVVINISGNSLTDTITTDSNGTAQTNLSFPPGTYNLVLSRAGFTTLDTTVTVIPDVTTYAIGTLQSLYPPAPTGIIPTSVSSFGNRLGAKKYGATATTATSTSTAANQINTGGSSELEYPAEWVYPDSGEGRYFTGTQARIYVGNLFIDEIDTFYTVYNNNRIPVYGYSSKNVDAFGQGKRLVQGQISVNFVSEGYLYTVLNEYQKKNASATSTSAAVATNTAASSLATLYQQQAALLAQQANGDKTQTTATALTSVNNQITSTIANSGAGIVTAAKQILVTATTLNSNQNAVQLNVPFDIVLNATAGGRTTTRKIKNCLLTSNEQVWDQSDNVIKDVYGFVATEMI